MGDQDGAVVQRGEDVFGAAMHAHHTPAAQAIDEAVGNREPKIRPSLDNIGQHAALQLRPQAATNGLNLRKLRHGRIF